MAGQILVLLLPVFFLPVLLSFLSRLVHLYNRFPTATSQNENKVKDQERASSYLHPILPLQTKKKKCLREGNGRLFFFWLVVHVSKKLLYFVPFLTNKLSQELHSLSLIDCGTFSSHPCRDYSAVGHSGQDTL